MKEKLLEFIQTRNSDILNEIAKFQIKNLIKNGTSRMNKKDVIEFLENPINNTMPRPEIFDVLIEESVQMYAEQRVAQIENELSRINRIKNVLESELTEIKNYLNYETKAN